MVIPIKKKILYKKSIFSVLSVCSVVKTSEVGHLSITLIHLALSFFRVFVIIFLHYSALSNISTPKHKKIRFVAHAAIIGGSISPYPRDIQKL